MKLNEYNVLMLQHDLIRKSLIWECPKEEREALLMYIAGFNDMAQACIESNIRLEKQR